jgi:hypothetical protein
MAAGIIMAMNVHVFGTMATSNDVVKGAEELDVCSP